VLAAELGEVRDGRFGENASDRIVRIAEDEKFGLRRDRRFECGKVDIPDAIVLREIDFAQSDAGEFRRAEERWIDRRAGEHFLAGLHEGAAGDIERGDESGKPDDFFGFGRVAVVRLQVFDRGFDRRLRRDGVAEDAVGRALLQGADNFRCGKKIHIGHPHGRDVASGISLPFERTGGAAVGTGGEIVGHERERMSLRTRGARRMRVRPRPDRV